MLISIEELELTLKTTWKISRNSSNTKTNLILNLSGVESEIAPNIRYGETPELMRKEVIQFFKTLTDIPQSISEIESVMKNFKGHHASRFGVESLLVHLLPGEVYKNLNLDEPKKVMTSFSLPIMEEDQIKDYLRKNKDFNCYKIKVDAKTAISTVQMVQKLTDKKLRVDANEGFENAQQVLDFLAQVNLEQIEFLEQPLASTNTIEQKKLFQKSKVIIIADESVEDTADFNQLKEGFHGINVKLMKAGGYLNGIRLLKEARKHGMKTMIGCMIETSLGIWSAMQLNTLADYLDLDGHLLIEDEPFDLVENNQGILSI